MNAMLMLIPLFMNLSVSAPADSTASVLMDAGFFNVRSAETNEYRVYTIEADRYKLPAEGIGAAREIVTADSLDMRPVKLIATYYDVPELTMTYDPVSGKWSSTKRLDSSWKLVRKQKKQNSSFGKVNILVYPQVSLSNLITTQVYQSLWQLSPAIEFSLWPGMKFSYQLKFPIYNDTYDLSESKIYPGMITLSQRFRDPWNLNLFGKLTGGFFSNNRYGLALELAYYFPNERFSVDTQLGLIANYYWNGFTLRYTDSFYFRWNVAANYYWPMQSTQFILRAQQFLAGDYGLKYEMIRHFNRCAIGLYAEKSIGAYLNVGFRFQIALPPFRQKRRGWWPKISTSAQMGMAYNANNEQTYYKEFRTEASDNIMTKNYFNPYFVDYKLQ